MGADDRPYVENAEFLRFAGRILRAMGGRAAADIDSLAELAALRDQLDAQLHRAILACRADGYSWADIGLRLGMTKQGVSQYVKRRVVPPLDAVTVDCHL